MTARHWLLVLLGLLCWAGVALLWVTSPAPCDAPDPQGVVECAR